MDEKKVFEIAYKAIFDRYCEAAERFDLQNMATVSEAEQASKELRDFETLATARGYEDILH